MEKRRGRPARTTVVPLLVITLLVTATVAAQLALWPRIDRPLWYDELWRPHFAGEPGPTFWSELTDANTPSSVGSVALTRFTGEILGWHSWSLRLVGAGLWLPVLAAGSFLLARRFTGVLPAAVAAVTVTLAGTVVDTGTQLKPYILEASVTLAVVALWMNPDARHPLARRTIAGVLALLSLPAVFLLVPLAVGDVVRAPSIRRVAWAVPGLVLAGAHMILFISHQSSQRASHFWDDHFLSGHGGLDAPRFIAEQVGAILGGAPPGIDRYDPNLVHSLAEGHGLATLVIGTATAVALAAGVRVLRRSPAGTSLLVALFGAELLQLVASAGRFWPFGAVRTNLFLVPLLTIVVAVGAGELARVVRARHPRGAGPSRPAGVAALTALTALAALIAMIAMPVCAVAGVAPLWRDRDEPRPIELMTDATLAARAQYEPGDLVIVGGRLARAGWLYGMELSDDGPSALSPAPVGELPRVPRTATVFLPAIGADGAAQALRGRAWPPARVLLFVLAYDRRGAPRELAALRAAGWCERRSQTFPLTGTLYRLDRCAGRTVSGDSPASGK